MVAVMFFASCGEGEKDDSTTEDTTAVVEKVNEFDLLIDYIVEKGDLINTKKVPTMTTAEKVQAALGETQLVIDMRSAKDFAVSGHISGAVNVPLGGMLEYFATNDTKGFEKVVLVCYSGQTASMAASVLQMSGYENVYAMKWGMSGWNPKFAKDKWMANISDKYVDVLEMDANEKNAAGDYPVLSTGLKTGKEIFDNQSGKLMVKGFKNIAIGIDKVMEDPSAYYVINYWPTKFYEKGHIPGAVQYDPKASLSKDKFLNTLPTDKTIVVYCFTGQHASFVAAYLNILGYDAKVLKYGANSFMNKKMKDDEIGHFFSKKASQKYDTETSDYDESANPAAEEGGC